MWGLWDISADLLDIHRLLFLSLEGVTGAVFFRRLLRLGLISIQGLIHGSGLSLRPCFGPRADVGLIVLSSLSQAIHEVADNLGRSNFWMEMYSGTVRHSGLDQRHFLHSTGSLRCVVQK